MNLDDEESLDTVLNITSLIHQPPPVIASFLSPSLRAPTCRGVAIPAAKFHAPDKSKCQSPNGK